MRKLRGGIFLLAAICWCFIGIDVQAEETNDRILFISSYSYAWEQVQLQIEGIQTGLDGSCTLDYEFMDTKRVDDETSKRLFYEGLAYRLSQVEPYDAVILGDDAALLFAIEYQEELFDGIPLIFEGVNDEELAAEAVQNTMITGVLERLSVDKNIELGLRINPDAKYVIAILDDTLTGETERKRFFSYAEQYPELEFQEIDVSKLTTLNLRVKLQSVPTNSILIYITMLEDASGQQYTSSEAIDLVTSKVKVPVIRMVESGIGQGVLGGNMSSMRKSGEIAAQLALEAISKGNCVGMGLIDSPDIYCVDANVMKEFDISASVLPEGTTIINGSNSFWEENREVLAPGVVLIGALVIIIAWVSVDNRKRRKLLQELEGAKKIVESASEHDFLTGIPNRNRFMHDLNELVENKIPCTVMMIDIDDFKHINDTMGHKAGDDALQQVAARLKEMQSQLLTPYRFAGDEFILILRSSQFKIVEKTAYECRKLFSKPFSLCGNQTKVCGSIGIASYPEDTEDSEQLIIYADSAMYRVKKNGKNDFAFYQTREPS